LSYRQLRVDLLAELQAHLPLPRSAAQDYAGTVEVVNLQLVRCRALSRRYLSLAHTIGHSDDPAIEEAGSDPARRRREGPDTVEEYLAPILTKVQSSHQKRSPVRAASS